MTNEKIGEDPRIYTIWESLHDYYDRVLSPDYKPEDVDEIWDCICESMRSIEEDLFRLKGLEK
jgi:RNAse (barnase) inhibitor barstar